MVEVKQIKKAIRLSIETGQPLFIEGSPGIGKSRIVKDTLKELGYTMIDVRLTLKDPTDLQGLPIVAEITGPDGHKYKATEWVVPSYFPRENAKICIFFDEINLAPPATQHAAYQLILDRQIQDYTLPKDCRILAAGNKVSDKTGVYDLNPALANRFLHIAMDIPSVEDWSVWAASNNVNPDFIAFLNFQRGLIWKRGTEKAYPTPRSWEFASILYNSIAKEFSYPLSEGEIDEIEETVALAIGQGAAREFSQFIKLRNSIPDVWDVVTGKVKLPDDDVGMWLSVIGAISSQIMEKPDAARIEEVLKFANTIKAEYGIIIIRTLKYANEKCAAIIKASPTWKKVSEKWVRYLMAFTVFASVLVSSGIIH